MNAYLEKEHLDFWGRVFEAYWNIDKLDSMKTSTAWTSKKNVIGRLDSLPTWARVENLQSGGRISAYPRTINGLPK